MADRRYSIAMFQYLPLVRQSRTKVERGGDFSSIQASNLADSLPRAIYSVVPLISSTEPRSWTSIQGVSLFLEHDPLPLRGLDTATEQSWQSPPDAVDRVLCELNVRRSQHAWNATVTNAIMGDMAWDAVDKMLVGSE